MSTTDKILVIFLIALIFYLLSVMSGILIPLVLAFLMASLFQPLVVLFKKIKVARWLTMPAAVIISLGIIFGVGSIFYSTAQEFVAQQDVFLPKLESKITALLDHVDNLSRRYFNRSFNLEDLLALPDQKFFSNMAGDIISQASATFGSAFMFTLYYILLLLGLANYQKFLRFVGGSDGDQLLNHFEKVQKSVVQFMLVKTITSFATGSLAMLVCFIFGIKFAIFWGFVTFVLNFIPNIGSTIATIFPVSMAFIQYDSIAPPFLLLGILFSIQFTIGNLIEPKIMGDRLRLNTLTVIFGLVFWGYLWGIPGMMLAVPLLVLFKLTIERIPSMRIVARIMERAGPVKG